MKSELTKAYGPACGRTGLVELAVQALDGTKIAANAAGDQTYDMAKLGRLLARTDTAIEDLDGPIVSRAARVAPL